MSLSLESRITNKQHSCPADSAWGLKLLSSSSRLVSPYTLRGCPAVSASLAAYDIHDASVSAAVKVIVGTQEAQGKLPIQLPIED